MRISDWSSDVCSSDLLYHLHDLPTDGGVDWRNLRQVYDRSLITSRGRWNIFTFVHKTSTAPWSSSLRKAISGQTNESNDAFWEAIQALQGCGMIEFVQHLVEADTRSGERSVVKEWVSTWRYRRSENH